MLIVSARKHHVDSTDHYHIIKKKFTKTKSTDGKHINFIFFSTTTLKIDLDFSFRECNHLNFSFESREVTQKIVLAGMVGGKVR
jgi:hypothetical protein